MKNRSSYLDLLPADTVCERMDSPVGELVLLASTEGLHGVFFSLATHLDSSSPAPADSSFPTSPGLTGGSRSARIIQAAKTQLTEYFTGKRKQFDIPLAPYGTDFQQQAWMQLRDIPYGETVSYGEQAVRLGDKKKARAVGMANGLNPISIIVPCHRVIGANGKLTGFGGGLDTKAFLLELEQA